MRVCGKLAVRRRRWRFPTRNLQMLGGQSPPGPAARVVGPRDMGGQHGTNPNRLAAPPTQLALCPVRCWLRSHPGSRCSSAARGKAGTLSCLPQYEPFTYKRP
jgi:hypothetical protein